MPNQDSNPPPAPPPDADEVEIEIEIEEPPMNEVHPPHEAVHSWKDVFIHIAIISVGLLIAIGLDEAVVEIHHRHQAHQLEESLRQESLANRDVVKTDITEIDAYIENVQLNMANLDHARIVADKSTFVYTPFPAGMIRLLPVSNTAWLAVRDGGSLSLLPAQIADDYWHTDNFGSEAIGLHQDIYKDFYQLDALLNLHAGIVIQSPEEKEQLQLAFARFNGKLRGLRSCYVVFDETNEIALSGDKFSQAKLNEVLQHEPPPPPY
jgi:hypothetical protein